MRNCSQTPARMTSTVASSYGQFTLNMWKNHSYSKYVCYLQRNTNAFLHYIIKKKKNCKCFYPNTMVLDECIFFIFSWCYFLSHSKHVLVLCGLAPFHAWLVSLCFRPTTQWQKSLRFESRNRRSTNTRVAPSYLCQTDLTKHLSQFSIPVGERARLPD